MECCEKPCPARRGKTITEFWTGQEKRRKNKKISFPVIPAISAEQPFRVKRESILNNFKNGSPIKTFGDDKKQQGKKNQEGLYKRLKTVTIPRTSSGILTGRKF